MARNSRFRTTSGPSANRQVKLKPNKQRALAKKKLMEKKYGFKKTDKDEVKTSKDFADKPQIGRAEKKPFKIKGAENKDIKAKKVFKDSKFKTRGKRNAGTSAKFTATSDDGLIRLNRYISNSGLCSRREADDLIKSGLVSVNGKPITELGYKVNRNDNVKYDGQRLKAEKLVYLLLNKPKGYITTTNDPQDRKTVMALIENACQERLYPVGRLDRNTSGVLLFTNDGALTDKLTHPSFNTKKIYKAELDKPLTQDDFNKILKGVYLEEGKAIIDDLAIISDDAKSVGIEIHIGWNRVVRRVFEALGYTVNKLDRSVFATLDKKDLPRGHWRFLRQDEVVRIKHFI